MSGPLSRKRVAELSAKAREEAPTTIHEAVATAEAMAEGRLPITEERLRDIALVEHKAVEQLRGPQGVEERGSPIMAQPTRLLRGAGRAIPRLKRGFLVTWFELMAKHQLDPARQLALWVGALDWVLTVAPDLGIADLYIATIVCRMMDVVLVDRRASGTARYGSSREAIRGVSGEKSQDPRESTFHPWASRLYFM